MACSPDGPLQSEELARCHGRAVRNLARHRANYNSGWFWGRVGVLDAGVCNWWSLHFRPNGPFVRPARANGPGIGMPGRMQAQRADRSPLLGANPERRTAGPLGLTLLMWPSSRAVGPGWVNAWPVGPQELIITRFRRAGSSPGFGESAHHPVSVSRLTARFRRAWSRRLGRIRVGFGCVAASRRWGLGRAGAGRATGGRSTSGSRRHPRACRKGCR